MKDNLLGVVLLPISAFVFFILAMTFGDTFKTFCLLAGLGVACLIGWKRIMSKM